MQKQDNQMQVLVDPSGKVIITKQGEPVELVAALYGPDDIKNALLFACAVEMRDLLQGQIDTGLRIKDNRIKAVLKKANGG